MGNSVTLAMFGRVSIASQLSDSYHVGIARYNEEVDRNRAVFARITDCVKFHGTYKLALHGHDESCDTANPGILNGLVDFAAKLDSVLKHCV